MQAHFNKYTECISSFSHTSQNTNYIWKYEDIHAAKLKNISGFKHKHKDTRCRWWRELKLTGIHTNKTNIMGLSSPNITLHCTRWFWHLSHWRVNRTPGRCLSGFCFKRWIVTNKLCKGKEEFTVGSKWTWMDKQLLFLAFCPRGGVKNSCFSHIHAALWQLREIHFIYTFMWAQDFCPVQTPSLDTVFVCICPTSGDLVGILWRHGWVGQSLGLSLVSAITLSSFSCRTSNRSITVKIKMQSF